MNNNDISIETLQVVDSPGKKYMQCRWLNCNEDCEVKDLLEHLLSRHLKPALNGDITDGVLKRSGKFRCLWQGCKRFKQSSGSYRHLEHHVTVYHCSEHKKFACIFENCEYRFRTRQLLARHVERHLKSDSKIKAKSRNSNRKKRPIIRKYKAQNTADDRNNKHYRIGTTIMYFQISVLLTLFSNYNIHLRVYGI
ncbi:hypothetical protein GJ496_002349 [Pomphorhynchus laevis]|nr:hypothetical protein GJ496_002349 [Pomphorhynchus laevis]